MKPLSENKAQPGLSRGQTIALQHAGSTGGAADPVLGRVNRQVNRAIVGEVERVGGACQQHGRPGIAVSHAQGTESVRQGNGK